MKPLREEPTELGRLLDRAAPLEDAPPEALARSRARFMASRREPASRARLVVLGALATATGAALVIAFWPSSTLEPKKELDGAAWSWVAQDGDRSRREDRSLVLDTGAFAGKVAQPLTISTPAATVLVDQATFHLLVAGDRLTALTVEKGSVTVRTPGKPEVRIDAPGHWESAPEGDAEASFHRWALSLEREGRVDEALIVLEALSAGSSVWSELAFYDAARLCAARHDVARAKTFIDAFEQRHPSGLLMREMKALRATLRGD